jgi:hypothetical protein
MITQPEYHQILFSIEEPGSEANRKLEEAGYKIIASKLLKTVNQRYETGTTKDQNQKGPEITLIPLFNPSKGISEDDFLKNITRDIEESLLKHAQTRKISVTYSRLGFPNENSFKSAISSLIFYLNEKDSEFELVSYREE